MAVGFNAPVDEDAGVARRSSRSTANSGASSVIHTPPLSPISPDHLILAFYEALYRCSQPGKSYINLVTLFFYFI